MYPLVVCLKQNPALRVPSFEVLLLCSMNACDHLISIISKYFLTGNVECVPLESMLHFPVSTFVLVDISKDEVLTLGKLVFLSAAMAYVSHHSGQLKFI